MQLRTSLRANVIASGFAAMLALGASAPAAAQSSSGTINVSLNVTSACVVNGATSVSSTFGQAGELAFDDQPGLFGDVDGVVQTSGGGALSVQCSPDATPTLTLGSGQHDASGQRYLSSGTSQVAYRLFSDIARTQELAIGASLPLGTATSTPISVPIFGRVNSGGNVIAAGAYTDTVAVTLTW